MPVNYGFGSVDVFEKNIGANILSFPVQTGECHLCGESRYEVDNRAKTTTKTFWTYSIEIPCRDLKIQSISLCDGQEDGLYDLSVKEQRQKRKHKKKRINKKWLKRYGYDEEMYVFEGLRLEKNNENNKVIFRRYWDDERKTRWE